MTLTDNQRLDAAMRLVKVVTGEPYGDGITVTDIGVGYAAGGSGYKSDVWVLGDWNDKTRRELSVDTGGNPTAKWVTESNAPSRLFDALERIGVNGEWSDEWSRCGDCQRLIRTQPDSYGWTPQYEIVECDYLCRDCLIDGLPDTLDEHINNVDRAITWLSVDQIAEHGWTDAFPDEHDAENGLHPGQNDRPTDMVARLREAGDQRDYLFVITDKGQFDMRFRLLVRNDDDE